MIVFACNGKDAMPPTLNQFRDPDAQTILRGPITREVPSVVRVAINPEPGRVPLALTFNPRPCAPQFAISEDELLDFTATTEHDLSHLVSDAVTRLGRRGDVEFEDTGRTTIMHASRIIEPEHEHTVLRPGTGYEDKGPDALDGFDVRLANIPDHVMQWMADQHEAAPRAPWVLQYWTAVGAGRCVRETWYQLEDLALVPERLPHGVLGISAVWFGRTSPDGTRRREILTEALPVADPVPVVPVS